MCNHARERNEAPSLRMRATLCFRIILAGIDILSISIFAVFISYLAHISTMRFSVESERRRSPTSGTLGRRATAGLPENHKREQPGAKRTHGAILRVRLCSIRAFARRRSCPTVRSYTHTYIQIHGGDPHPYVRYEPRVRASFGFLTNVLGRKERPFKSCLKPAD